MTMSEKMVLIPLCFSIGAQISISGPLWLLRRLRQGRRRGVRRPLGPGLRRHLQVRFVVLRKMGMSKRVPREGRVSTILLDFYLWRSHAGQWIIKCQSEEVEDWFRTCLFGNFVSPRGGVLLINFFHLKSSWVFDPFLLPLSPQV